MLQAWRRPVSCIRDRLRGAQGGPVAHLSQAGSCNGAALKGAEQLGHRGAKFLLDCSNGPVWAEGRHPVLQQRQFLQDSVAVSDISHTPDKWHCYILIADLVSACFSFHCEENLATTMNIGHLSDFCREQVRSGRKKLP